MITTKTKRQRLANSPSSVNSHTEHGSVLANNTKSCKPLSWVVRKKFPIAGRFGHLRSATGKSLKAPTHMAIKSKPAVEMNSLHAVPNLKFSCNFYGFRSGLIH